MKIKNLNVTLRTGSWVVAMISALLGIAWTTSGQSPSTAFTYQGTLTRYGAAVNGAYDFQFILRDAASGGNALGTNLVNGISVSNGLFAATLDYGAGSFPGAPRWLEVDLRTNGSVSAYSVLTPNQPVNPSPYAISAASANFATSVATGAIGPNQIADQAITLSKLALRQTLTNIVGVGGVAVSSLVSTAMNATSPVDVTNLVVTLQTVGRPVHIMLVPDGISGSTGDSGAGVGNPSDVNAFDMHVQVIADGSRLVGVSKFRLDNVGGVNAFKNIFIPASAYQFMDFSAPAGQHTYKVQFWTDGNGQPNLNYVRLVAYEL